MYEVTQGVSPLHSLITLLCVLNYSERRRERGNNRGRKRESEKGIRVRILFTERRREREGKKGRYITP